MGRYVLDLREVDRTHWELVGGKAATLGELSRLEDISVPAGFCVTTDAFRKLLLANPTINGLLNELAEVPGNDSAAIGALSAELRRRIEAATVPDDLAATIHRAVAGVGPDDAYAIRSSATAEDLATASFAGQQDTYLNVIGPTAILSHIRRCWASLFTDRAVTYRIRNDIDHRRVAMAVVVQRMVSSQAAGILFTADPRSGNRLVSVVEASHGLGEAVVSGIVTPDVFSVREDRITSRTISTKQVAVLPTATGGTRQTAIEPARRNEPALTDAQVVQLGRFGRRIEAHFGCPQDIEWCMADGSIWIVQSRPITTLFPIPVTTDRQPHVYVSVGHQQMMTDAMKPLGISFWQLTTPRPMAVTGGRLFVDVTANLASPGMRTALLEMLGRSDPLILDALQTVLEREDFVPETPGEGSVAPPLVAPAGDIETDPSIVADLIASTQASIAAADLAIRDKSGPELIDFILSDLQELRRVLFDPRSHQAIMAGMESTWWLNDHLAQWLGEQDEADALAQSAPNNVTSEMGLALLDVADAIRPHPLVVAFLRRAEDDSFLDDVVALPGGPDAQRAIQRYLDSYGMRCVGEIDITRPRWSEQPSVLVPMILSNIDRFEPGEAHRRFDQGLLEAEQTEQAVLARLLTLPDGQQRAARTKAMIDRLRTFIGYREYPKYAMISRYFLYKQALLGEAERLVRAGALQDREDCFFLSLQELHEVTRTHQLDQALVRERRAQFRSFQALSPPRVLTSEGEAVSGSYRRANVPAGALVGLPVSGGTVEGRARVILDMATADLAAGDILVTAFTDPSWTPLFVAIEGLVTEVGGLMTHGAVIAREYGLPTVVGVQRATQLIKDGQRIRLHGTEGYVELLD